MKCEKLGLSRTLNLFQCLQQLYYFSTVLLLQSTHVNTYLFEPCFKALVSFDTVEKLIATEYLSKISYTLDARILVFHPFGFFIGQQLKQQFS